MNILLDSETAGLFMLNAPCINRNCLFPKRYNMNRLTKPMKEIKRKIIKEIKTVQGLKYRI